MEQIKSSTDVREKIIAAARNARKSSIYPHEIFAPEITCYTKEHGLVMDDFKHLHNLIKEDHILTNGTEIKRTINSKCIFHTSIEDN